MIQLVHLAPEGLRRRIERSGLRGQTYTFDGAGGSRDTIAVFAMPVLADFSATYQWLRELRRWRRPRLVAVHFRIPSDERVLVGAFAQPKEFRTAGDAVRAIGASPYGQEVVVCRHVSADEVRAIRDVRQDVGWVETPNTGHAYECVCKMCLPPGSPHVLRRARAAFRRGVERLHSGPADEDALLAVLRSLDVPLERVGRRLDPKKLLSLAKHESVRVRVSVVSLLGSFQAEAVEGPLTQSLTDAEPAVTGAAVRSLVEAFGARRARKIVAAQAPSRLAELVRCLEFWPGGEDVLRAMASEGSTAARAALDRTWTDD